MSEIFDPIVGAVLRPVLEDNLKFIYKKIKNRNLKIAKQDISIYATMFVRFNSNLSLDAVNKLIIKSISKFCTNKQSHYRVERNNFLIISNYTYAQPSVDECLLNDEYSVYPNDPLCCFVPGVTGVTIYVFPESIDRSAIKNIRVIFEYVEEYLLKNLSVKQRGRFMYFDVTNSDVKETVSKKLSQEFERNKEVFYDYSRNIDTELKLRYLESMHIILAKIAMPET